MDRRALSGSARLVSYEPERVVARASAQSPGLLVLTDVHYPGWKATVDGREVPIERVDYLLRGVPIPAGTHEVEFRYEPASFRAGWIISAVSTLAVLIALLVGWRRRRHQRGCAGAQAEQPQRERLHDCGRHGKDGGHQRPLQSGGDHERGRAHAGVGQADDRQSEQRVMKDGAHLVGSTWLGSSCSLRTARTLQHASARRKTAVMAVQWARSSELL